MITQSGFQSFYNKKRFADVRFQIQSKIYYGHRIVCAAKSKRINHALQKHELNKSNNNYSLEQFSKQQMYTKGQDDGTIRISDIDNVVNIEITHLRTTHFEFILKFMYEYNVINTINDIQLAFEYYDAAKRFGLDTLMKDLEQYVIKQLEDNNMIDYWEKAVQHNMMGVDMYVKDYINKKFHPVVVKHNPDFSELTPKNMLDIIKKEISMTNMQMQPNAGQQQLQNNMNQMNQQTINSFSMNDVNIPYPLSTNMTQTTAQDTRYLPNNQNDNVLMPNTDIFGNAFSLPPIAIPHSNTIEKMPDFFQQMQNATVSQPSHVREPLGASVDSTEPEKQESNPKVCYRRMSVIDRDSQLGPVGIFFQHIISSITTLLHCERTTLFIYDAQNNELCSQVSVSDNIIRRKPDEGHVGQAFQSRQSKSFKHAMCVPLIQEDDEFTESSSSPEPFGVIEVLNKETGSFNENDRIALQVVSRLLCVFIKTMENSGLRLNDATNNKVLLYRSRQQHRSVPFQRARSNSFASLFHKSPEPPSSAPSQTLEGVSFNQQSLLNYKFPLKKESSPDNEMDDEIEEEDDEVSQSQPSLEDMTSSFILNPHSNDIKVKYPSEEEQLHHQLQQQQSLMMPSGSIPLLHHDQSPSSLPPPPPSSLHPQFSSSGSLQSSHSRPPVQSSLPPRNAVQSQPKNNVSPLISSFRLPESTSGPEPVLHSKRRRNSKCFMHFRIQTFDFRDFDFKDNRPVKKKK